MKKIILVLLVFSAATAKSQTLKELLYSNKLKTDSSGVIRRTDDLTSKIDTTQKKTQPEKQKPAATITADVSVDKTNTDKGTPASTSETAVADTNNAVTPVAVKSSNAPVKSNTKIWKEYTDALVISLKPEILSSKKIKKDTYYFTVEYEIGIDGVTSISNISVTPENSFLLSHVQQRISDSPPQLAPVLNSAGQPQKIKRKHNFFIIKE